MILQYKVSLIPAAATLELRQKVLKPFLHVEECWNPGDNDTTSFHMGLYHGDKLVSISSFVREPHPQFAAGSPFRLRGMATDPEYRAQGFGQILLQHGMGHLRDLRADLLWCNARQRAFSFYERMGFFYHGPLFEMSQIGPHKVMYRYLVSR